jgi:hypothetical protein
MTHLLIFDTGLKIRATTRAAPAPRKQSGAKAMVPAGRRAEHGENMPRQRNPIGFAAAARALQRKDGEATG